MPKVETNTRRILARLQLDGWVSKGGRRHEVFIHPDRPETLIPVPRHRELTPLTARSIAKAAGWLDKEA
jgi:predicted RNA binding protein YcfA (HicA-like mRNA interferase family)